MFSLGQLVTIEEKLKAIDYDVEGDALVVGAFGVLYTFEAKLLLEVIAFARALYWIQEQVNEGKLSPTALHLLLKSPIGETIKLVEEKVPHA